jgi:hypothetical protein
LGELLQFLGHQILVVSGLVAAAVGLGSATLPEPSGGFARRYPFAAAVGLAVWAQLGFALALGGRLRREWLLPFLALALCFGWREIARGVEWARRSPRIATALAAAAAGLGWLALYPALAFDETLYHLPWAQALAGSGRLEFLRQMRDPVFPLLGELLQAEVLLLGDATSTHFVAWLAALGVAGLVYAWAAREAGRPAGILAASLWLGTPQILYLSGTDYLEPLLALWTFASLVAVRRYEDDGNLRWLVLAGGLVGSAAAAKYLGLFCLGWVGLEVLLARRPRRWLAAALFAAVVALAAGPTYLRLWTLTGNPLFPYAPHLFGINPWTPEADVLRAGIRSPMAWLSLPWDAVFRRQLVGGLPPFSPALLFMAPLLVAASWRDRRSRRALVAAACYSALVPIHARFLVLVLPPLAATAGVECGRLVERWPGWRRPAMALAIAAALLPGAAWLAVQRHRLGPLPTGPASSERFWSERLPLWRAVRALDDAAPDGAVVYVMTAEQMRWYANATVLGDWTGELPFSRAARLARRPCRLHTALRTVEADYLLWPRGAPGDTASSEWGDCFERLYADGFAEVFRLRAEASTAGGVSSEPR